MWSCHGGGLTLELATPVESKLPLTLDVAVVETVEERMERLISENPVIILSRPSCFMSHVMKKLLSNLRVHPMVVELEEEEEAKALLEGGGAPVIYIGGRLVGGLESLMALHVTGILMPMLVEASAV